MRIDLVLVVSFAGIVACHPEYPSASRNVCSIRVESASALPRLYREANAEGPSLGSPSLLCDVPLDARSPADECASVDDLDALLDTGRACGPAGAERQHVCPSFDRARIERLPSASIDTAPCANACPNVEVAIRERSGTVTRVVFYDDPACHTEAEPGCEAAAHVCYYRVLAASSDLR